MLSLSGDKKADIIEAYDSLSRYPDDLLYTEMTFPAL